MTATIRKFPAVFALAVLAGALLVLPGARRAAAFPNPAPDASSAQNASQRDAEARLNKSQFDNVHVAVENGVATLTGSVQLYEYKADAAKRVLRAHGVEAVRNLIQVGGSSVSDAKLRQKLGEEIEYDRVGFGNAFNAITVAVDNGVVTLGGHARTYVDRDSALALVNTTPGVKDVVNDIQVDPVSIMDDQIRLEVARAVYGYPILQKYSINPARPIRISVQNGHVSLYGVVDSEADKNAAFLRANGVPGVFGVKNYLQVANQPTEAN
ncbi:MAG TPA: BON domain-containing protein, partial [Terracidiphilus sp.]|nr:BON domain-containing protein [Terracidiphilus sp.]